MSAQIKLYQMWEAFHALALDDVVFLHTDHIAAMAAASAYDEEKERALFEADTLERFYTATFGRFPMSGGYNAGWVQERWDGWQACAKARAKAGGE
jgi:hypothetical protein